ncbi:MAG: response regulator [Spirochaetes bacterium]|nr:response regulator [Spirochaetota bacterium]
MLRKRTLLLVEDDPVQQALIERMVSQLPYALTITASVEDAMAAFAKGRHEVVLCDINLPGRRSGVDLLRELKEQPNPPVVVMCTVDNAIGSVIDTMRLGAFDYIVKPAQQHELAGVLAHAAEQAQTIAAARIAERERAEHQEQQFARRRIAEQLVRRQNDKFSKILFGNMFTAFSQGRGVGSLTTLIAMLVGSPLAADQKNYLISKDILDLIFENQDAVNSMIEMFSEMHLLVSQGFALEATTLDTFHKMVRDLVVTMAPTIKIGGHSVFVSDLPPRFSGETLKLNIDYMRKALQELIMNALKFSPEESTILILVEYHFTHVLITILNEPIGGAEEISVGQRRMVFEPYYRISRVVREKYKTLEYGLGLSFVDQVVALHNGKVRCTTLKNYIKGEMAAENLVSFEIELPT